MKLFNNNKLLNSKKGLSFFTLLALVSITLFFLFVLAVSNPHNDSIYDEEFKSTYAVDSLSSAVLYNNFYVSTLIQHSLDEFVEGFFSDNELNSRLTQSTVNDNEFLSCTYNNNLILYNEAYLKSQMDENKNNNNSDIKLFSCFPEFGDDFMGEFLIYVESKLTSRFRNFFNVPNSDLIDISVNSTNNEILVNVKYKSSKSVGSGLVYLSEEISTKYDLGNFNNLVLVLDSILPKLSENVKTSIISCKKTLDENVLDGDLECIGNVFKMLFKQENNNLYKDFNFEFTRIDNEKVLSFYSIGINVLDKKSKKSVFDFSVVLKNNLPIGQVDYNLFNLDRVDNVIGLKISKPNLKNSSLYGFVILYSYENFLDRNSYSKYDKLINLLEESKIPDGFVGRGINIGGGEYRGSDKELDMDLSLFFLKDLTVNSNNVIDVKIHQIWNDETSEFDLIENKKVYFAVFAVDEKFNYFTDESLLNEVFSSIDPIRQLGPEPLKKTQVKMNADISDFDNSVEFEILNYDDSSINNFELYVLKGNLLNFNTECITNKSSSCQKFDFGYINEFKDVKFLISSDINGLDVSSYGRNVFGIRNFALGDGSDIRFFIIPVNSNKLGFYETVSLDFDIKKVHNYYDLLNSNPLKTVPTFSIKISDNRAPDYSEITGLGLRVVNNKLILDWGKTNVNSDVEKVMIKLVHSDSSGKEGLDIKYVGIDGDTKLSDDYSYVEVTRAVPVDGNMNSKVFNKNIDDAPLVNGVSLTG